MDKLNKKEYESASCSKSGFNLKTEPLDDLQTFSSNFLINDEINLQENVKIEMEVNPEFVAIEENEIQDDLLCKISSSSEFTDTVSNKNGQMEYLTTNLSILDGTFFKVVEEASQLNRYNLIAQCIRCQPRQVFIKGKHQCSSNFLSHLKRIHGNDVLEEYNKYAKCKRYKNFRSLPTPILKTAAGQPNTSFNYFNESPSQLYLTPKPNQDTLNEDIFNLLIHCTLPLQLIENNYFLKIFENLKVNSNIFNRKQIDKRIDELYLQSTNIIKQKINTTNFICTIINIWNINQTSFLSVTFHWIDTSTLERKSAAIAFRKTEINNQNLNDKIHSVLNEINTKFIISSNKIIAMLTAEINFNANKSEISKINLKISQIPNDYKCAVQILNMSITSDLNITLCKENYFKSVHENVLIKCNYIWSSESKIVEYILGHGLTPPQETSLKFYCIEGGSTLSGDSLSKNLYDHRSFYESLKQISSIENKSDHLFQMLNHGNPLTKEEFIYINEYINCTKPVWEAIDVLQNENNSYYGVLLPCLLALKRKLEDLVKRNWIFCQSFVECVLRSLLENFESFFNCTTLEAENAVISAMVHPKFKKKWFTCISSESQKNRYINLLKQALLELSPTTYLPKSSENSDDFFDFGDEVPEQGQNNKLPQHFELELLRFFEDNSVEISSLYKYPTIKKVFEKYNTPLHSFGVVNKLISFETIRDLPISYDFDDEKIEKRILLRANLN